MHTIVLIALLGGFIWVIASVLAHRQDAVDRPSVVVHGVGLGVAIGGACALVFLTTQVDLIPDQIEEALLPAAIILTSLGLILGTLYRVAWR
jgi:hypothetical protein